MAARATISETVSRLFKSSAVCQPLLYSRFPATPAFGGAGFQFLDAVEGALDFIFAADDADQVLHHALQVMLDGVGILAGGAAIEGF